MDIGYLDGLDAILALGVTPLSHTVMQKHAQFVSRQQQEDGGFPGRLGASDTYYTDFALRTLKLCGDESSFQAARGYLQKVPSPVDIVTTFSTLNCARILGDRVPDLHEVIEGQSLASGGYSRRGETQVSAYETFLALLCYEIMGEELPDKAGTASALRLLQCTDGGFADIPGGKLGQTNATAAAVATLLHCGVADLGSASADFLVRMQAADGGLMAHAGVGEGDLLSTFTGLLTLFNLDAMGHLNLPALGKFVRILMQPEGGFRAAIRDGEADIEYTYYGLGTIAILRAYLMAVE
ncbi:MAG: prenyltransferase/squalene oxidase repeat-containing protein [bacterium]